jgi:serine/threonine-protein kinase
VPTSSFDNAAVRPVPPTAVREQLARVVGSSGFVSSARLCRFLTHVVNRTIDGDADSLKEFSVAMEVFDRSAEYDPNIDAIVRVEARRLRTKMKAYYDGAGKADPVLIGLRPGSYVPVFRWLDAQPAKPCTDSPLLREGAISIAVLPFVNMSPEPDQDYFCDGITEEITNSLTRVTGLKVIARTSAFHFKGANVDIREVAQRLGADMVIEGSVRKAGEQLRITAQAIQAESGHHYWSETFRRHLPDVFAIQEEIAQSVAELLRLHLPEAKLQPPTNDVDAYNGYLRARSLIHHQSVESLHSAIAELRKLMERYPRYAPAYSGMAVVKGLLAQFGVISGQDAYAEVKANAERGYELAPESGEACTVLGALRAWFEHRWHEAKGLYDRALKLQPSYAPAHMFRAMALLCQGDFNSAESGLYRSMELDPLSPSDSSRMAYVKYVKGDYPSAEEHLRQSFESDPNYAEARLYKSLLHFQQQRYSAVIHGLSSSLLPLELGLLAAAYGKEGKSSCAGKCVTQLQDLGQRQYVTPLAHAFAAVGMGDMDLAFQRLDEAISHKTNFVTLLAIEPFFNPLQADPRFAILLQRLNLSHAAAP